MPDTDPVRDVQRVARGDTHADLVVRGGRVYRPETRRFDDVAVAVVDDTVAALTEHPDRVIGPDTTVVEASEKAVVPGFVDAHTHLDLHQAFDYSYQYALRGGSTTLVTELASWGELADADAVDAMLDATADLPVSVHVTVPPGPCLDTFTSPLCTPDDLAATLDRERVVGVGEAAWIHAVGHESPLHSLYDAAHDRGLTVGSHAAGCRGDALAELATLVDDDHESISGRDHVERVENGIHSIARVGTIRDDAQALGDAYAEVGDADFSLSTDGTWPRDLVDGAMDTAVERAIEEGVDPVDALRMATLTPAKHFGLDGKGTLAPGADADILVLDSLDDVDVSTVVAGGEVVVDTHDLQVGPQPVDYPERAYDTTPRLPDDFLAVPAPADADDVRAIEHEGGLLTSETTVSPDVRDDELHADPDRGVLKAALYDRSPANRGGFVGFLTGVGLDRGAVATTITWETAGVLAVGTNDADMRTAADRLAELGGGWVVVDEDEVVTELPAPLYGFCTTRDVTETEQHIGAVEEALRGLGATADRPFLALQTLTFVGVPSLKLTVDGYADVKNKETVGLST
ncbi:adenine deaminase C-terminal domain-containing protein [Salarchaeum sp. III]|uniref:adenine deaminase C-terminal domain-containing protein n=1 Tax=Salarchaeum sp. III TaxID=3107927 RepID=UPI002ED782A6